eukprot:tig00000093_g3460.t1
MARSATPLILVLLVGLAASISAAAAAPAAAAERFVAFDTGAAGANDALFRERQGNVEVVPFSLLYSESKDRLFMVLSPRNRSESGFVVQSFALPPSADAEFGELSTDVVDPTRVLHRSSYPADLTGFGAFRGLGRVHAALDDEDGPSVYVASGPIGAACSGKDEIYIEIIKVDLGKAAEGGVPHGQRVAKGPEGSVKQFACVPARGINGLAVVAGTPSSSCLATFPSNAWRLYASIVAADLPPFDTSSIVPFYKDGSRAGSARRGAGTGGHGRPRAAVANENLAIQAPIPTMKAAYGLAYDSARRELYAGWLLYSEVPQYDRGYLFVHRVKGFDGCEGLHNPRVFLVDYRNLAIRQVELNSGRVSTILRLSFNESNPVTKIQGFSFLSPFVHINHVWFSKRQENLYWAISTHDPENEMPAPSPAGSRIRVYAAKVTAKGVDVEGAKLVMDVTTAETLEGCTFDFWGEPPQQAYDLDEAEDGSRLAFYSNCFKVPKIVASARPGPAATKLVKVDLLSNTITFFSDEELLGSPGTTGGFFKGLGVVANSKAGFWRLYAAPFGNTTSLEDQTGIVAFDSDGNRVPGESIRLLPPFDPANPAASTPPYVRPRVGMAGDSKNGVLYAMWAVQANEYSFGFNGGALFAHKVAPGPTTCTC